jgi:hypothetical protein
LNSTATEKQKKSINRLFLKFKAFYGYVWVNQFQGEFLDFAKNEWLEGLKNFDESSIESATKFCRNTRALPPTLPKFVEICRSFHKQQIEMPVVPAARQPLSQVGIDALKAIKTMLNMT